MGRERRANKIFEWWQRDSHRIEANLTRAGRYQHPEQISVVPACRPIFKAALCSVVPTHLAIGIH
jgi:hypothetical protein